MKKAKIAATLLALSMAAGHQAHAFGLGDLTKAVTGAGTGDLSKAVTGASTGGNVSGDDVDAFIQTARQADQLINQSARLIYLALASQEEKAKHEAAIKAANEMTDVSEKKAKLDEINADTATALQKTLNNQETINSINKMSAAQRKNLAGAAFNFMLGLMKDKALRHRLLGRQFFVLKYLLSGLIFLCRYPLRILSQKGRHLFEHHRNQTQLSGISAH